MPTKKKFVLLIACLEKIYRYDIYKKSLILLAKATQHIIQICSFNRHIMRDFFY